MVGRVDFRITYLGDKNPFKLKGSVTRQYVDKNEQNMIKNRGGNYNTLYSFKTKEPK